MLLPTLKQHIHTHTHPEEELIQYSLFFYSFVCLLCLFLFRKTLQYHRTHTHRDTHIHIRNAIVMFREEDTVKLWKKATKSTRKSGIQLQKLCACDPFFLRKCYKEIFISSRIQQNQYAQRIFTRFFYSNKKESNIHSICIINKNSSRL